MNIVDSAKKLTTVRVSIALFLRKQRHFVHLCVLYLPSACVFAFSEERDKKNR